MEPIDCGDLEKFRHFLKDDFEPDWIKVAEGQYGKVYKVKLKLWRETFAMKCFSEAVCGTNVYRRMMEEASKMEKVKFKYIVSFYGVCSETPAVVMEYMPNGSLDGLLQSHTLMWPKKFQMIHEITMGMNFLHTMKPALLHLNLKPANILLDDHLHVKISDFGLIKWEEYSNSMEFIEHLSSRGNISYIAPEIFTQSPDAPGTKYDVYSFAIVIWEVLTQKKPYPGANNIMTVIMKVSSGKRPSVEKIPDDKPQECDDMIDIMQKCWQQEATSRPPFSETVAETEALSEVLKIPDVIRACRENEMTHKLAYTTKSSCLKSVSDENSHDDVTTLLSKKNFESFRGIVKKDNVLTAYPGNNSLLHYTVASGDLESVKKVIELGAMVDAQSSRGYTPLIVGVLYKSHEICSLLLKCGANPNLGDSDCWTALHFASQNGDERMVRLLLDRTAEPDSKEKEGWMPLHLAAQNGHENVVRVLLPRLSNADQPTADGRTALHLAARHGHLGIVQLLLRRGANPNHPEGFDGRDGTPLHLAAAEGHFRVARLLISSGADISLVDNKGYSAVHWAAVKGHTSICRLLLGKGAQADLKTVQGWTPLHLAALKGHPSTVLLLEEHVGSLNVQGASGWTPLHLACYHGREEVVSVLLTAGADPNLIAHNANVNGQNVRLATPLHLAAANGSAPIVQALLLNGARKDMLDASGFTAKALAQKTQKKEVMQLLDSQ
ncbi:ankyrin repeat and protein kinase domain-containing protein 1-like [Scleropages formosus]|uniref:Ankyrin repeat and protein kinase domain-containing protein 1-like n=1 Tax=Scleropages formosus TaxID=113540 RepID=A0A0P7V798_SCLFO|nr:ankyrin repeat and protein kinase domain-containing protein 1-like [Scleropages formosus]